MISEEFISATVPLSDAEKELIKSASKQYEKDLSDLIRARKMRRLMESLEPEEEKVSADGNVIYASSINSSLLCMYNLISVDTPTFIGMDNETVKCEHVKIDLPEDCMEMGFQPQNIPLLYNCLREAQNLGYRYLLGILRYEGKIAIRGSK